MMAGSIILEIAYGVLGLIFIGIVGLFFFLLNLKAQKTRLNNWLKQNGKIIEAIVLSADIDNMDQVSATLKEAMHNADRFAYVVIAQWVEPSTRSTYTFRSVPIWIDPRNYVKAGDKIKVFIDPNNPMRYLVDTSFLPVIKY